MQQKHYSLLPQAPFWMTAHVCRNGRSEPCRHIAASCESQVREEAVRKSTTSFILLSNSNAFINTGMISNGSDVSHSRNKKEENIGGRIIDVGQNPLNHFNHIYNN